MKQHVTIGVALAAVAVVLVLGAWSNDRSSEEGTRTITVNGDAEVRVVPDEVILVLGVETWNEDLQMAKRENDQRVAELLSLVREHGVEDKHVQTDHMSIEARYHDAYEKRGFVGYFCRKTVVVTLRDISRFEDLVASALETGATHVHGIQFRTTELRAHKDEARALAIVAAREKAEAMAGALGQKVGAPQTIHENQTGWWSWYSSWWGSRWGGSVAQNVVQDIDGGAMLPDGTLAPGQIAVRAQVTVSFALQ